jgi:hypothetical protein
MQQTSSNAISKREELKTHRNLLFKRFLRNPQDTSLALKIKIIDDQLAAFTEQMERERDAGLSSPRFLSNPFAQSHHGPDCKKT